ncbi:MAG: membrane protein insertase YidC [Chiayiivirga sp.]|jgi:YidC/Oxa1 family membrane protein insertase|nr:membrane protein insertase YidC [Chiayiivirga sp.]
MTQTRTFLLIAWLLVAFLLWDAWQKDYGATRAAPPQAPVAAVDPSIPEPVGQASVPTLQSAEEPAVDVPERAGMSTASVILANDVLRLTLDANGGTLRVAELLDYPTQATGEPIPVELLSQAPEQYFVIQNGLVGQPAAPTHEDRMIAQRGDQVLAEGADEVVLPFVWSGPDGLSVERTYRMARGSYLVEITDTVRNDGTTPWSGNAYRQLVRVQPPTAKGGFTNPERLSYVGGALYSPQDKFEKRKFDEFDPKTPLRREVTDGWIAMLQHYFVAAIIPEPGTANTFSSAVLPNGRYLLRDVGAALSAAPGGTASTSARIYLGPKLRRDLETITPGLGLTMDYGIFTAIAQPIHWLLALLHSLVGNWGWAIVLLVVLIKAAMFKLSEAQYKSFAKMRRVQPRIEALKERFGDDRQKFQVAMMELYKKEKINPLGGCLPILVQIPVFLSLYWVLVEAVELRHAPWILWIQNLSAPDPYFILPVVNLVTMWATQKLSPAPGMDPMQKKMMQAMPLVFGVMFAFFPAGLVLYWTTNGALGLLQQWLIMRRHGEPTPAPAK